MIQKSDNISSIVFSLFNSNHFSKTLCQSGFFSLGKANIHTFPDQETLIKIETSVHKKPVIIIASLNKPNDKISQLIFTSETLRDLGAARITLIAPYLPYMRQDKAFHEGEGITAKYFAKLISTYFDELITIDPHLHRYHALNEIFNIPTRLLHATHPIAHWIEKQVTKPLLIGPDAESTQWVSRIANICKAPYLIVEKTRMGDSNVTATIPRLEQYSEHNPVLIDDIISTGTTMLETIKHIQQHQNRSIVCIGVHGIFANSAYEKLLAAGVKVVTCNTIAHPSNEIDLTEILAT